MKAREMTDMASCPLVTVLIPVRDAMPFLKPAFLGIQHQTHKNLEIFIIDDGSTDPRKNSLRDLPTAIVEFGSFPENIVVL